MALQPEVIPTRPGSSHNSEEDYRERSNLKDLLPSTGKKKNVGDGLFLEQQGSNPSNEMAALDSQKEVSPGFKKK